MPTSSLDSLADFVRHDNPNQGPVSVREANAAHSARRIPTYTFSKTATARPLTRRSCSLLDGDHNGTLSDHEKSQAHIILFGHSWGASAVVLLARELDRVGVPVLLTVQVDSVAKPWQHDDVIPEQCRRRGELLSAARLHSRTPA